MSKTITVYVRYKSLYVSLPSSAKQQREITKAASTRIRIFLNPQLFLSGFKNFPVHTRRIQIEFVCPHASDCIRTRCSTQGSSAIKCVQNMRHKARDSGGNFVFCCCCAAILVYCSMRDWTRICYVIEFENIRIHQCTRYRIRCGFNFFPLWRADLETLGFAVEFAG